MDNSLREIFIYPLSDIYQVNGHGQLMGVMGKIVSDSEGYFTRKFNGTYVLVNKNDTIEKMLNRGDGDFVLYHLQNDMGPNVTYGPILFQRSCLIASRPPIRFSSDSTGLETSLISTGLHLMIGMIFLWLLLLSICSIVFHRYLRWKKGNLIWMFIHVLLKQCFSQQDDNPVRIVFPAILLITLILHIIYGSFLSTERANMTLYDRIDTLETVEKRNIIPLKYLESQCIRYAQKKLKNRDIRPVNRGDLLLPSEPSSKLSHSRQADLFNCFITGRCVLFATSFELKNAIPIACSLAPISVLDHPFDFSRPIQSFFIGLVMNKYVKKKKLAKLAHFAYRDYEMGLTRVRSIDSAYIATKLAPKTPDPECMDKKIKSRRSAPEPLSLQFYEKVFILYLVVTLFAMALRIIQCILSTIHI